MHSEWRSFALAVVGYAIYAASSTALAEMMKRLIDGIQHPDADFRYFLPLCVIMMFAARGVARVTPLVQPKPS